ncbi:hypothetical protein EV127DRAFT_495166 [Xylaria flabelliformis]|nr:hypothetical protein EV127DRAFT_495166 [Xylaria flabelliformis]
MKRILSLALLYSTASIALGQDSDPIPLPKPTDHPEQQLPSSITQEQMQDAEPPRDPVDVQNWFGTSLYGFDGCGDNKQAIKDAYKDANKIASTDGVKSDIDWSSNAALEFLGPPALNKKQQPRIQAVMTNMETVRSGWAPRPFANWIQARCDDPKKRCTIECPKALEDEDEARTRAYSINPSELNGRDWPYINFCPPFFELKSLGDAMKDTSSNSDPRTKFNLENYITSTFLHELFHIDLAADSVKGTPNPKIRDLNIRYNRQDGSQRLSNFYKAYGSLYAKILARFVPRVGDKTTGYYVQRNDDNLSRFALAKYVEKRIGSYPFLPQVYWRLDEIQEPNPRPNSIGVAWENDPEHGAVLNLTYVTIMQALPDENGKCPTGTDLGEDDYEAAAAVADEEYPSSYLDAQKEWFEIIKQASSSGTCKLNMTEIWTCEPVESDLSPGLPINDASPLELQEGGMKETLKIVGEHTNDYIQFYYGDIAWRTTTDSGPASCKMIGDNWDQNGPANCPSPAIFFRLGILSANTLAIDEMEDETNESSEPPDEYSEDNDDSINDSAAEMENDNAEDDE